jgi:phytoene dehydrogenase-like protein
MTKASNKYDIVVIGAGISGLVCGCYLAKSGMKVLIVEKNSKAGGYCTSVSVNGVQYNLGIVSMGNYSDKSRFKSIFEELGVSDKLKIRRINPANEVYMPDFKIVFGQEEGFIADQLQSAFPRLSKKINSFFDYILTSSVLRFYVDLKNKTYSDLLDEYFDDEKLIATLCFFLSALGLSSKEASALSAVLLFREFIMNGDNFLIDDFVDKIPSSLTDVFLKYGGDIILGSEVNAISVVDNNVKGVLVDNAFISADSVVSSCDPIYTYQNLISGNRDELNRLKSLNISNSAFILYMTIKKSKVVNFKSPNIWSSNNYDTTDDMPSVLGRNSFYYRQNCTFIGIQSRYNPCPYSKEAEAVFMIVNARTMDELFWREKANILRDLLLNKAKSLLGLESADILSSGYLTPTCLVNLTHNLKGSMRGWASTAMQNSKKTFTMKSPIENLYFSGQWVTNDYIQGGMVMSSINAKEAANCIIKNYKNGGILTWN